MSTPNELDFLDLPDDQVMNMAAPAVAAAPVADVVDPNEPPSQAAAEAHVPAAAAADGSTPAASAADSDADGAADDDAFAAPDDAAGVQPAAVTPPAKVEGEEAKPDAATAAKVEGEAPKVEGDAAKTGDEAPKTGDDAAAKPAEAAKAPTPEDHKALYDALLGAPIRANGKDIQLQSPDEVKKLVQMGLNYTKKMQAMQPAIRVVKMLENSGLMDESKLSHLIDLSKGDKGAIQKLLADTGFDPMSADAEQAAKYVPADHRVTDLEITFGTVLEEVEQTPAGVELISEVHGQWDADSKQALFREPQILAKLAEQKALGLYATISSEVDRLRTLGQITPDIPFLQAYHAVGQMLHDQGRLAPAQQKTEEVVPPAAVATPAVPVETRVVAPTPVVKNTAQAQAAAQVRTTPTTAKTPTTDWLSMDDAAFAKESAGRY